MIGYCFQNDVPQLVLVSVAHSRRGGMEMGNEEFTQWSMVYVLFSIQTEQQHVFRFSLLLNLQYIFEPQTQRDEPWNECFQIIINKPLKYSNFHLTRKTKYL